MLPELRFSGLRGQPVIILDRIVGGVELWELLHFTDQIDRIELFLTRPHISMNKSAEALGNIANPPGFAIFTVTDHIHASLGLLTHNVCDFLPQKLRKSRRIVRQILLARGHDLANGRGPYEAANMANKDTIRAAFHAPSPPFVILIWSILHRLINS